MRLNLARTLRRSAANGPGERFVLWVQGCPLACEGCWNRDTWSFNPRQVRDVADVLAEIRATPGIEGVTFSGGEPFVQARALAELGRAVGELGLSVFIFTGYRLGELTSPAHRELLGVADVLVAGRYMAAKRSEGVRWLGSSNQRVHFLSSRYSQIDMDRSGDVEILVDVDGTMTLTGFPPSDLFGSS